MKVKSKTFKGIEYIQFSELPHEQQGLITKTLNSSVFIKILIGGKIQHDCIQFKDYVAWYENIFKSPVNTSNHSGKQTIGSNANTSKLAVK